MSVKFLQLEKTPPPIFVTLFGMLIFSNELHLEKTLLSISVTLSGILIFSKLLHPLNAE